MCDRNPIGHLCMSLHVPIFRSICLTKALRTNSWGDSLGGFPSDEDCFVNGKLSASRCEERDWYQRGITRLKALAREKRVAIMCAERDPQNCHRSFVVGETVTKDADFAVQHIDKAGELVPHSALEADS